MEERSKKVNRRFPAGSQKVAGKSQESLWKIVLVIEQKLQNFNGRRSPWPVHQLVSVGLFVFVLFLLLQVFFAFFCCLVVLWVGLFRQMLPGLFSAVLVVLSLRCFVFLFLLFALPLFGL
ncbi:hypothetical protein Q3G72_031507 [Acer saccharum]|nr:hypothetical protein Q3G72_031507 [Acer saccharum]